jgi:7-carboxy-7-deazaguanine synthase
MTYAIAETFYTLQGEGFHAGTPAQFIRFAGCNMWSGREQHRERDADRNAAACPRFCDTDFLPRQRASVDAMPLDAPVDVPLVVLTGGEPLLQVDDDLIAFLRRRFPRATIAVETNGTRPIPCDGIDWVCVSPKVAVGRLELRAGDELKVVVPAYAPSDYAEIVDGFTHRWVSAEAVTTGIGRSLLDGEALRRAAEWVMLNPKWRLTVQAHKMIGIP